ncbi:Aspartate/glutamate/uridylate kinase [Dillenia turbinata]|uniref:acetylglutamate kinase n=1 Tax=Dillenia turbinata TaxID=194707 RepID=A0AAN8V581_9MAGN
MLTVTPQTLPPLSFSETLKTSNLKPLPNFSLSQNPKRPSKSVFSCLKSHQIANSPPPPPPLSPGLTRVDVLSESLPFIQKFRGKTIVVKYGGAAMKSHSLQASVINDLVLLSVVGLRPVLVHGGGPEINNWLSKLGLKPNFLNGLRVTDSETMEIVEMVLVGKVNKHLVSLINNAGATAVGLSGKDGRLLTARPSPKSAQLGFVGEVANVNVKVLRPLIDSDLLPVIASVAADESGQSYNINADTVAGELAAALEAEKLILLTDVAGILEDKDDPGSLVKQIDIKGIKQMVDDGKIAGGMIPKVKCCVRSLAQGVRTASIIDGRVPHSLLLEILTDEGAGTMICGAKRRVWRVSLGLGSRVSESSVHERNLNTRVEVSMRCDSHHSFSESDSMEVGVNVVSELLKEADDVEQLQRATQITVYVYIKYAFNPPNFGVFLGINSCTLRSPLLGFRFKRQIVLKNGDLPEAHN